MQHVLTLILLIITTFINHTIATTPTTKYKIYRTLVFPCGSGIGLEIADALKNLKEIELVGATSRSKTPTHCPYVYPKVYDDLPTLRNDEMLRDRLIEILSQERVDNVGIPVFDLGMLDVLIDPLIL